MANDFSQNNDYTRPSDAPDPTPDYQGQIDALTVQMHDLIRTHQHSGLTAMRNNFNTDLIGLIEVVTVAPTGIPTSLYQQIKIAVISGTSYIYVYDQVNHAWKRAVIA